MDTGVAGGHCCTWTAMVRAYPETAATGIPSALHERLRAGERPYSGCGGRAAHAAGRGAPVSDGELLRADLARELEETFQVLALALTAVGIMVAGSGAATGWYATRHSLRPLTAVADAAEKMAAGDFTTRLAPTTDPDLARLSTSFNHMVDELARRVERDRRFAADVSHELRSAAADPSSAASVLTIRRDRQDARTATAAGLVSEESPPLRQLVDDLDRAGRAGNRRPPAGRTWRPWPGRCATRVTAEDLVRWPRRPDPLAGRPAT